MIFLRNAVYTTVCCLGLILPSLVHADAPVVNPTADYNNNNSNPDAADYAGSSGQNNATNNSPVSNSAADNSSNSSVNSAANNNNSSASFPSAAQPSVNQTPSDNSATNDSTSSTASMSLDDRVAQLERQIAAMNQLNLLQQVSQLQQQVQDLTGQLAEATHSLQMLQNQQKNQYADLDQRLSHLENPTANKLTQPSAGQLNNNSTTNQTNNDNTAVSANNNSASSSADNNQPQNNTVNQSTANNSAAQHSTATTNASATSTTVDNSLDEQQAYQKAYNLIKNKDYSGAANGMAAFVKQYPNSSYALNAHYWLGELYLLQNMPGQAAVEFHTVISNYPQNPKTGDAMLKLGFAYADEQKWTLARKQLQIVQTRFTGTATGQLAAERLKEMKLQGH